MSNLQNQHQLKLDIQKVDQHTSGKLLIHSTKRQKGKQLKKPGTTPYNILVEKVNMT